MTYLYYKRETNQNSKQYRRLRNENNKRTIKNIVRETLLKNRIPKFFKKA